MAQGLLKKSKPSTAATKRYVWAGSGYPWCDFGGLLVWRVELGMERKKERSGRRKIGTRMKE